MIARPVVGSRWHYWNFVASHEIMAPRLLRIAPPLLPNIFVRTAITNDFRSIGSTRVIMEAAAASLWWCPDRAGAARVDSDFATALAHRGATGRAAGFAHVLFAVSASGMGSTTVSAPRPGSRRSIVALSHPAPRPGYPAPYPRPGYPAGQQPPVYQPPPRPGYPHGPSYPQGPGQHQPWPQDQGRTCQDSRRCIRDQVGKSGPDHSRGRKDQGRTCRRDSRRCIRDQVGKSGRTTAVAARTRAASAVAARTRAEHAAGTAAGASETRLGKSARTTAVAARARAERAAGPPGTRGRTAAGPRTGAEHAAAGQPPVHQRPGWEKSGPDHSRGRKDQGSISRGRGAARAERAAGPGPGQNLPGQPPVYQRPSFEPRPMPSAPPAQPPVYQRPSFEPRPMPSAPPAQPPVYQRPSFEPRPMPSSPWSTKRRFSSRRFIGPASDAFRAAASDALGAAAGHALRPRQLRALLRLETTRATITANRSWLCASPRCSCRCLPLWGRAAQTIAAARRAGDGRGASALRRLLPLADGASSGSRPLRPRFGVPAIAQTGSSFSLDVLEQPGAQTRAALFRPDAAIEDGPRCLRGETPSAVMRSVCGNFRRAMGQGSACELPSAGRRCTATRWLRHRAVRRKCRAAAQSPRGVVAQDNPDKLSKLRVAHLSDLHVGKGDSKRSAEILARLFQVVTQVNQMQPDLVVVTGDLVHRGQLAGMQLARSSFCVTSMRRCW